MKDKKSIAVAAGSNAAVDNVGGISYKPLKDFLTLLARVPGERVRFVDYFRLHRKYCIDVNL